MANAQWIQRRLQRLGMSPTDAAAAAATGDPLGVIALHELDHAVHTGGDDDPPLHSFSLVFENALV